jgi:hypothetical protein
VVGTKEGTAEIEAFANHRDPDQSPFTLTSVKSTYQSQAIPMIDA